MATNNRERIDGALQLLAQALYPYVEEEMKAVYADDWPQEAKSDFQGQKMPKKKKFEKVLKEDVSLLLKLFLKQWDKVFKKNLDKLEKAIVEELIEVRNNCAHGSDSTFSTEDTYRAFDSITRLLRAISASEADEVEKQKQEVFKTLSQEQFPYEIRPTSFVSPEEEERIRERLQEIIEKIPFKDASLLQIALTHRSYLFENPEEASQDNNRLEFLGDALLGFISGAYLYKRNAKMKEGEMTPLRSKLVENSNLAKFASHLNIGEWILLGKGEETQGGREKESLLSDTFEAIIGAYFLDSGIEAVRDFLEPLFDSVVENLDVSSQSNSDSQKYLDPKGKLQQWAQANGKTTPVYKTSKADGPDHEPEFISQVFLDEEEFGEGRGRSKKQAEKGAAENALANIEQTSLE
jgi:ribonuclease-3